MTEADYELLKKKLQKAAYLRGKITKCKKEVRFYTHAEMAAKDQMFPNRAEAMHKKLVVWIEKLNLRLKEFREL